jgi:simple sugar transport system permease protein
MRYFIFEVLVKSTPLVFTALSFSFAAKCALVNLGAEGQLYIGGLCAAAIAVLPLHLALSLQIVLAVLAGFAGGALWGLVAAAFKLLFRANEVITTLMLNYIAMWTVSAFVSGPLRDSAGTFPRSALINPAAVLPRIVSGTRVHAGVFVALFCVMLFYVIAEHTTFGFELRATGANSRAAYNAGINTKRCLLLAMLIAGGLAGLGGAVEVLGVQRRLLQNFSAGLGFDGIAVALLGRNKAGGIMLAGLFFGALHTGASALMVHSGVSVAIVYVIEAATLLFLSGVNKNFRRRLCLHK